MRFLVAFALAAAACGTGPSAPTPDVVCQHHAQLATEYGLLLAKDGSDVARCVKDEERSRQKLGETDWAPYASCLMAAKDLVEWMACDPAPHHRRGD